MALNEATVDLVLLQKTIDSLAVRQSGSVDVILADGSQIELRTHTCLEVLSKPSVDSTNILFSSVEFAHNRVLTQPHATVSRHGETPDTRFRDIPRATKPG